MVQDSGLFFTTESHSLTEDRNCETCFVFAPVSGLVKEQSYHDNCSTVNQIIGKDELEHQQTIDLKLQNSCARLVNTYDLSHNSLRPSVLKNYIAAAIS